MGTATEAAIPVHTDTRGELFELASRVSADPLDCPVATVVVEIVPEIESPEVRTCGVICLDIGKIEENAIVSPAVIPDELVVVVHTVGREILALALRASLRGTGAKEVELAVEEHGSRLEHCARMEIGFLLWKTTGAPPHLEEAHRLLLFARDHAPEEYRVRMLEDVPPHYVPEYPDGVEVYAPPRLSFAGSP